MGGIETKKMLLNCHVSPSPILLLCSHFFLLTSNSLSFYPSNLDFSEFELRLKNYDGDDPLEVWLRYDEEVK